MAELLVLASDRLAIRRGTHLSCQVVEEEGFTLIAKECLDLSFTGMAVRALKSVPLGAPVIVSFRVPGSSYVCDFEGEVARLMPGRRRRDVCTALGIRFLNVDPLSRAMLSARLCGLPPPLPARRLRMDYAATIKSIAA